VLKKILAAVGAIVALLVAFIATRPSNFKIERSTVVGAQPTAVYAQLADFERWSAWSPWEKLDPAMKRELTGTPGTVGHAYHWSGNDEVGEGRMTITALAPFERVEIRLEFLKPWEATNATTFLVKPEGSGSRVTWAMSGTNGFVMKAMGLVMNMDELVGADFERGLHGLQAIVEAPAAPAAAPQAPAPR
jgi:hypothetical protein